MVIFHGYVSHNQMVDSPTGGFTAFFSKIQGVAWGKTFTGKPWFKNHQKPSFFSFSRENSLRKLFCPILGHNSMKNMKLSACICCQSCQSSMCRLHFSHLLYWFTEAEGGEWVLAALLMSKSCKIQGEKEMRKFENETITRSTILGELHCLMIQDLWR